MRCNRGPRPRTRVAARPSTTRFQQVLPVLLDLLLLPRRTCRKTTVVGHAFTTTRNGCETGVTDVVRGALFADASPRSGTCEMDRGGPSTSIRTRVPTPVRRRNMRQGGAGGEAGPSTRRAADVRNQGWRTCVAFVCATTWLHACVGTAATTDNLQNVPDALSADATVSEHLSKLSKSNKTVPRCTSKCVATCVRGGGGAPGLGPMSVRKAPVVFEEGFRTRGYCIRECTEICALQADLKDKR